MKKIAVRVRRLKRRVFEKMRRIKSIRFPAPSAWLGIYGDERPTSLVPIPIRSRHTPRALRDPANR